MAGPWANESEGSPVPLVDSHIVNLHYLGELAGRNTVGFLVFFFELDNFSDRIMVLLTTMLVIAITMQSIQGVSICPQIHFFI